MSGQVMRDVYTIEIDGQPVEVHVWAHDEIHWCACAIGNNGRAAPSIRLKRERYRTMEEAAERAIKHFYATCT